MRGVLEGAGRGLVIGLAIIGFFMVGWDIATRTLFAQPAATTIPAPTGPVTVTVTISAADAALVHAAVAPPYTAIPLDPRTGQPAYTTLEGAVQHQLAAVVRNLVEAGRRARIEQLAADVLALEQADREAVEQEIKKRQKPKKEK